MRRSQWGLNPISKAHRRYEEAFGFVCLEESKIDSMEGTSRGNRFQREIPERQGDSPPFGKNIRRYPKVPLLSASTHAGHGKAGEHPRRR
ncbi:MAG: hypothetical protein C4530_12925 [Desulfobacteraceae bacterium]|nr:MAG: hypothetical protein C4530_12925 [Desulfobacteraceae bacterium]